MNEYIDQGLRQTSQGNYREEFLVIEGFFCCRMFCLILCLFCCRLGACVFMKVLSCRMYKLFALSWSKLSAERSSKSEIKVRCLLWEGNIVLSLCCPDWVMCLCIVSLVLRNSLLVSFPSMTTKWYKYAKHPMPSLKNWKAARKREERSRQNYFLD